jgi:hypothetical protein
MIQGKNEREAGRLLAVCFMLVSFLDYSSTLNMEATYSSEIYEFQRTTRRYVPEDTTAMRTSKPQYFLHLSIYVFIYYPFVYYRWDEFHEPTSYGALLSSESLHSNLNITRGPFPGMSFFRPFPLYIKYNGRDTNL